MSDASLSVKDIIADNLIVYPELRFTVEVELKTKHTLFLEIIAVIDGEEIQLGHTKTKQSYMQKSVVFPEEFAITYYVGLEDTQYLLFKLVDGDVLRLSQGFVLRTVEVKIADILNRHNRFPITLQVGKAAVVSRDDLFGFLLVHTTVADRTVELDFESNEGSDRFAVRFFRAIPPRIEDLRDQLPYFKKDYTIYKVSISLQSVYASQDNLEDGVDRKSVMAKLCWTPSHDPEEWVRDDLPVVFWTSRIMNGLPYSVTVTDMELTEKAWFGITDEHPQGCSHPRFVLQVYLLEPSKDERIPPQWKLLSYYTFKGGSIARRKLLLLHL